MRGKTSTDARQELFPHHVWQNLYGVIIRQKCYNVRVIGVETAAVQLPIFTHNLLPSATSQLADCSCTADAIGRLYNVADGVCLPCSGIKSLSPLIRQVRYRCRGPMASRSLVRSFVRLGPATSRPGASDDRGFVIRRPLTSPSRSSDGRVAIRPRCHPSPGAEPLRRRRHGASRRTNPSTPV